MIYYIIETEFQNVIIYIENKKLSPLTVKFFFKINYCLKLNSRCFFREIEVGPAGFEPATNWL